MNEMQSIRISVLAHFFAGIVAGAISSLLSANTSLFLAILILFLTGRGTEVLIKEKKDFKWWLANGVFIFLFTWIVSWIFFYN